VSNLKPTYKTNLGLAFNASIEEFILSAKFQELRGTVDLILTSPPYPLVTPKAYGNRIGDDYKSWLADIMTELKHLLKPKGSLVVEIGNAWDKGQPTMSTLPIETLIQIKMSVISKGNAKSMKIDYSDPQSRSIAL
jgi:site-specific DNA-methyltransferase (cytosine-N4-specific)